MDIKDVFKPGGGGNENPLPAPNASVCTGLDEGDLTEKQVRGMICNPIYAGIPPFPALVSDETWIRCAALLVRGEGPEQFLVNLLFVLRQVFGNLDFTARPGAAGQE